MQYIRILSVIIILFTFLRADAQDVILFEHELNLRNTKKLPEGELNVYLPKNDSFQIFDYFEFSVEPDSIFVDGKKNNIAKWSSNKIKGLKALRITAIGFLSYFPSNIKSLNRRGDAARITYFGNGTYYHLFTIGSEQWLQLKIAASQWIEIKKPGGVSSKSETREAYNLFKICDSCETNAKYISFNKNRFRYSSDFKMQFHRNHIFTAGTSAYTNHKLNKALVLFNKSILLNPNYLYNYTFKGITLARLGNFESAQQSLQVAMRKISKLKSVKDQSKDKGSVLFAFSNLYALQNKKEKAVNFLRQAIKLDPSITESTMSNDEDLINLKDYSPFIELLKSM